MTFYSDSAQYRSIIQDYSDFEAIQVLGFHLQTAESKLKELVTAIKNNDSSVIEKYVEPAEKA